MSEQNENKECKCCVSPDMKKFLLGILASFIGCLIALCLYSAALRPVAPAPCPRFETMQIHHIGAPDMPKGEIKRHPEGGPDKIKPQEGPNKEAPKAPQKETKR